MPTLPDASPSTQDGPPVQRSLTAWQQAALSLYWFANSAHWSAILIILLPHQAALIGGEANKGTTLGMIQLAGAFVSMVVAPVFGAWSDRISTRWGRRKPFLFVGTLGNMVGLGVLAALPAVPSMLVPFIAVFMWTVLWNNLATAPYAALIPDVVPAHQRGSASGWMGLMTMLGNAAGAIFGLALGRMGGTPGAYLILAGIMLLGMLGTVSCVREPRAAPAPPQQLQAFLRGLVTPFQVLNFRWVFLTRFLVMLGVYTVQGYLLFYIKDVVAAGKDDYVFRFFGVTLARSAPEATSIFLLTLLVGAVVSSLLAGILSDRYGRKRMVYLSGALQGVVALTFLLTGRFEIVVVLGVVFGLGYGAYQAVDWALATDVLPNAHDHAKDMGVWHIAATLPQVTAAPLAGVLLDTFQKIGRAHGLPTLGYIIIFGLAIGYFAVGTMLVSKIKGVR
jgi:MFS family permease